MSRDATRLPGTFRPADPVQVVRDSTLGGRPVLLLGWWLGPAGDVVAVEVASFTSDRRPYEVGHFPTPPAAPLRDALALFAKDAAGG